MNKFANNDYDSVAKFLHWSIALMIFFNLTSGVVLVYFSALSTSLNLYEIHKQFGALILILAFIRLLWRISHRYPRLTELPLSESILANFGVLLMYALMFAIPISGIYFTQSSSQEVHILNFKLFQLISPQPLAVTMQFFALHKYLAILIAAIVGGHTLAALKHHYLDKNDILRRMLPNLKCKKNEIQ
ncbi:MAG: cytochrome b [Neisseriaceae bacterium]|nr:MAG: cytochrome b [Neisseriaceae bacterium]